MATALKFILEMMFLSVLFFEVIFVFHEVTKSKMRKFLEGHGFECVSNGRYLIEIPNPVVIDFNLETVDLMNGVSYHCKQCFGDDDMIGLFAHAMKDSGMVYQLKDELRDLVVSRSDDGNHWKLMVD